MGGGYYEREDDVPVSSSGISTSSVPSSSHSSNVVGTSYNMNPGLDPSRFVNSRIVSTVGDPVVFALDVTGSMGAWTKIIYDKMPMFYGQILTQKYLQNPAISFCGIGDTTCDKAPLQVSDFGQGKEIDQLIAKMYLEGGGGGGFYESYEMSAYFYLNYATFYNARKPFFFCTGDEGFYETVTTEMIEKVMKQKPEKSVSGKKCWQDLMKKFNVFLIKKEYSSNDEQTIKKQWFDALGKERVLYIKEPKACIDVMLGAICLTSGSRTLDDYIKDMKIREQTKERIKEVTEALTPYWEGLKNGTIKPVEATNEDLPNLNNDYSEIKTKWQGKLSSSLTSNEEIDYFKNLTDASINKKSEIPKDFLCPITGDLFYDPVIAQDMNTYERIAIEMWFGSNTSSPITGNTIEKELIPNVVLKKLISDFYNKIK